MVTEILLIILVLLNVAGLYLHYKALPAEKKLEVKNQVTNNETIVMDWEAPETDEQIAFREAMSKLNSMRK